MKILHVITSLEIGGAQRLLSDLLPLQAKTEDVSLLVYKQVNNDFVSKINCSGVKIISLNEHNFYNPRIVFRMRKIFKDYNIIHAHLFPTIYWASLACRGLNVKLIYTEHSTSNARRKKWYFRFIEKFMYARYDAIISISKQTQEALKRWLKSDDAKFMVVNNGVDISNFSSVKSNIIPKSLIMVSRFATSKDQETVIRAMQYIPKASLRLVGEGEKLEYCRHVAIDCKVKDRVHFLGPRSNVAELVSESYIGIQSSNWEGFGLTAVEIMACGKPIVATNVDGLRQVVEGAGLLFSVGNYFQLAQIVNKLIDSDDFYNKVSERCFERAKNYSINETNSSYIKIYTKICRM